MGGVSLCAYKYVKDNDRRGVVMLAGLKLSFNLATSILCCLNGVTRAVLTVMDLANTINFASLI